MLEHPQHTFALVGLIGRDGHVINIADAVHAESLFEFRQFIDAGEGVLRMLKHFHSTGRNLLFDSADTEAMQKAFNPKWDSAVPYTVFIDPDGKILYEQLGSLDILKLRRTILGALPSDYIGFNQYWSSGLAASAGR